MLRMLPLVMLGSSSIALAQVPPAPPTAPAQPVSAPAEPATPADVEVMAEEPKMKKVCRRVEVVGSSVGRSVCTMKPVRTGDKPKGG